jgi:flagellar FliL protein
MPDTTSPDNESTEPKKGGVPRLVIVGILCAVIAAAGFVLGGRLSGGAAAAPESTVPEEEPEPEVVAIVELDALNVNLAGGHYLRIAVALGLGEEALHGAESGGHGGSGDAPPIETAPASDLVLSTFSGRTMEDLATEAGREDARHDLHIGLEEYYGEGVVEVLFTEFVMQ